MGICIAWDMHTLQYSTIHMYAICSLVVGSGMQSISAFSYMQDVDYELKG